VETLSSQESEARRGLYGFSDSVCVNGHTDEGSDKSFSVDSPVCDRGLIVDGSAKSFSVDVSVSSEGSGAGVVDSGAGVEESVDSPGTEAFHVKAAGDEFDAGDGIGAGDGSADVANRRGHELGLVPACPACRDELTSPGVPFLVSDSGLESPEVGSGSVSTTATSLSLGFGLSKSQIWLLEWIKDRLKIHEEVKDEDHSVFLKDMEEEFRLINLVAREEGRLLVDEEDIRWICMVACEEGRWEVDEEEDDRKVAWMIENKEKISLSTDWPGPGGKNIFL
jgi:hypothetical protein